MLSGRRLDVIDPSPLDIEIGDIAHGLAFQARWNGQTKGDFVPEQQTDYIFSTVGEEWGFLGSITVILMFCFLIIRILKRAEKQNSKFRRVLSYGVAGLIFVHFFVKVFLYLNQGLTKH